MTTFINSDCSTAERKWRQKLFRTLLVGANHTDPDHCIGHLLKEPYKEPEYSLDFYVKLWNKRVSPLALAVSNRCQKCLVQLLEAGEDPSKDVLPFVLLIECTNFPFDDDIEYLNKSFILTLLQYGADVNFLFAGTPCWEWFVNKSYDRWVYDGVRDSYKVVLMLLEHAHIPFDAVLKTLTEKKKPWYIVQKMLRHGYIPDKTSVDTCTFFYKALRANSVKSDKVVHMMRDQAPMIFQASMNLLGLREDKINQKYLHLLKKPASLQTLCKGVIISTMGHRYVDNVRHLPLDWIKKRLLYTVKETE